MKAIFLDIDGVLNQLQPNYYLDETCIKYLGVLYKKTDSEIVLTSSWRKGFTHNESMQSPQIKTLVQKLNKYGMRIYGRTRVLKTRYDEILCYVAEHSVHSYIILDDDPKEFMGVSPKELYLVNYKTDLTGKDVKTLLKRR